MTTDVNAQFDTERAGQIAAMEQSLAQRQAWLQARIDAGEMDNLGGGRYRVNAGWDRGEVFQTNEQGLLMPVAGIDMVDGVGQGLFAQPEWHGLGNVAVVGLSDVHEALKLAGLDWEVEQRKLRFNAGGSMHEVPDAFVNVRNDTWAPLGVVGRIYTAVQNQRAFEFLQELIDRQQATIASAFPMRGGKRVVVSMKLPEGIVIDADGINDEIDMYLALFNNHDGQGKFEAVATPWRPRCRNTERLALQGAVTRWGVRHTTNALTNVAEAQRNLGLVLKYREQLAVEENKLAQTDILLDEFDKLVAGLWETPDQPSDLQARRIAERGDKLHEIFAAEAARCGRTAYAAERAVTGYLDHVAPRRIPRDQRELSLDMVRAAASLEGADDEVKGRAHRQLLTLTNR